MVESPANGVVVVAPSSPSAIKSSDSSVPNDNRREKNLTGLLRGQRKLAYYLIRDLWSVSVSRKHRPSIAPENLLLNKINQLKDVEIPEKRGPLKVMFFSSHCGGGHKASAASLEKQFQIHFPGSHCESFYVEEICNALIYKKVAESYKTLTSYPNLWRVVYHFSNARAIEPLMDAHLKADCEERAVDLITSYNPDVIVSVHPNSNLVPWSASQRVGTKLKKHIPFFTVVTDLGSGHCGWFQKDVDQLYLASEKILRLAVKRGRTPLDRISLTGLPIRHEFDVLSRRMIAGNCDDDNNGTSEEELKLVGRQRKHYQEEQRKVKEELSLHTDLPMVLIMGGGEGVGSLFQIVCELYSLLVSENIGCTICVVCGKNADLKAEFEQTDWDKIIAEETKKASMYDKFGSQFKSFSFPFGVNGIEKSNEKMMVSEQPSKASELLKDVSIKANGEEPEQVHDRESSKVKVVPLGFVTRMAEYMAAAEILITKAGPGTIAEAASVGLPLILTGYLPGQEAGNVSLVLEQEFGTYSDKPCKIAKTVSRWMRDPTLLHSMSNNALKAGHPSAASDIVLDIGSRTHTWLESNMKETQTDTDT